MSKRFASNYLTDQNFEEEDEEPEEAGSFKAANPDIMKNRQIKIARRRGAAGNSDDMEGTSSGAFKGFAGFTGLTNADKPASSGVSFSFAAATSAELATKLTTASASFNFSTSVTAMASSSTDSNITSSSASLLKPPVSTAPVDSTGLRFGTGQTTASLEKTSDDSTKSSGSRGEGIRFDFFKSANSASAATKPPTVGNGLTSSPASSAAGSSGTAQYRKQLKTLNETVLKWIDQHVRLNPDCILTPVFDDYNRYLAELDRKFPRTKTTSTTSADKPTPAGEVAMVVSSTALMTASSVEATPAVSTSTDKEKTGTLTAAAVTTSPAAASITTAVAVTTTAAAVTTTAPSFSFGLASSSSSVPKSTATTTASTTSSAPFSFGSGSSFSGLSAFGSGGFGSSSFSSGTTGLFGAKGGFTFGSAPATTADSDTQQSTATTTTAGDDDEEYVPPKPEVVEIKEDDAFYTVKCKLFYMLSGSWKERGVGNLYLKPTAGGKTQLLVRADNNLGTILLNIMLSKSIPTDIQGKNAVSLSCIPNPPVDARKPDPSPICMLIRVKTAENATELLQQLNDNKK